MLDRYTMRQFYFVLLTGLEPILRTFRGWNATLHHKRIFVATPEFESETKASKTPMLPLHHVAVFVPFLYFVVYGTNQSVK